MFFFGRGKVVEEITDSIRKSQNIGLFGLRKTGKTSVLYKVKRTCEDNNVAHVLYLDCKTADIRELRWRLLLSRINDELLDLMKRPKNSFPQAEEVSRFQQIVASTPKNVPICIMFDEIEYISPLSLLDKHWRREFIDFWQVMWSTQSRFRKLSIIIAGVNPYLCEIDLIDRVQNPIFGIVKEVMLTGLQESDTYSMVRRIGRQMGLTFDDDGLAYLHERYGGHPLLTRMACSFTNKALIQREVRRPINVTRAYLVQQESTRESDLQFYCRHVVSELKQFYDTEYALLEKIARGEIVDFLEFAAEPEYVKHLKGYGLISVNSAGKPSFRIPVIRRYITVETARQRRTGELRTTVPENDRAEWLARRKDGIFRDLKHLLMLAEANRKPGIYNTTLLLETDHFASTTVCSDWDEFGTFINQMNQTFVETIDHVKGKPFFFKEFKELYPYLFQAFSRIRLLRNNSDHLRLRGNIDQSLRELLDDDLFGRELTAYKEPWFLLQQICVDETFASIQYEKNSF